MTDNEKIQNEKSEYEEDQKKSFFKKYLIIFSIPIAIFLVPLLVFTFVFIPNTKNHHRTKPKIHVSQEKYKEKTEDKKQKPVTENKHTTDKDVSKTSKREKIYKRKDSGFWKTLGKILSMRR